MDNKNEIFKIQGYDEFKCTAEKCKFTCCEGWDINIDEDTYDKWSKHEDCKNYVLNNVEKRSYEKVENYFINKEIHERCPFLDRDGLCNIIKKHGEAYVALACRSFPRIENVIDGKNEFSLSCACPQVVELISNAKDKIKLVDENGKYNNSDLLEVKIRGALINILQQENISLDYKLIVAYQMLLELLKYKNFGKGALLNSLDKYGRKEIIEEVIADCNEIEADLEASIEETNYLFIDIVENYKEVEGLKEILGSISDFAEEVDLEALKNSWNEYKELFEKYDRIMENCIVSKVFSNCVSSDLKEMIISFELIILEYILVRYAGFIKYSSSEKGDITLEDIKDYIVIFSRVIGNNTEAAIEFIREGFGDEILEIGYFCFISLF